MLKSLTLLYVEDDDSTINAFRDAFSEYFKEVIIAKDGEEGFQFYKQFKPDIIVSDLQLPKLNGLDMIERIRKIDSTLPIIVNSAFSDTHLLLKSIDLHVDSYILKPTDPYQLLSVMEKAARVSILENLLHTTKEMMQTIIDEIPDPILYINTDYTVMMLNKAAKVLDPHYNDERRADKCYRLSHDSDKPCSESDHPCPIKYVEETKKPVTVRHIHFDSDGLKRQVEVHMRPIFDDDGQINAFLEISHDITEYLEIQDQLLSETQKLSHISLHDPLTQLPNRRLLNDRIEQTIEHKKRSGGMFAVFFIDLDHFKEVNDSLGHLSGDQLLIEVAKRITKVTRKGDTVARIGGDEFVLIVENGSDILHFSQVADKLQKLFKTPFLINGKKLYSACSIGISIYPSDADDAEMLLSHADAAMYSSKESGRNKYNFYTKTMTDQATNFLEVGTELKEAIKRDELVLYYQPTMDIATQQCLSMEVLIRWNHPTKGIILPGEFLPVAHKSGLDSDIDAWVLHQAIATYHSLKQHYALKGDMAINITVETLLKDNFVTSLHHILDENQVSPHNIVLEIVETSLIIDVVKVKKIILRLHDLGVRIAIDDFGTGYSSLSYILDLDVDILKIDQSFIKKIGIDEKGSLLIKSIIALSKIIGTKTIAEGVETDQQLQFLINYGVDSVQGYYFAKPMNKVDLIEFIASHKSATIKIDK